MKSKLELPQPQTRAGKFRVENTVNFSVQSLSQLHGLSFAAPPLDAQNRVQNCWAHGLRLTHRLSFKGKCHGWECVLKHGSIAKVPSNFISRIYVPAFIFYAIKSVIISVSSYRKRPQHSQILYCIADNVRCIKPTAACLKRIRGIYTSFQFQQA